MSWQCSLMCAAVYLVTMPWSMRYFRSTARAVEDADSPDIWRVIWLLPALASLVVLIFTNAFDADSVTSWTALIARLSLMFSIMVVCYVLMRSLDGLKKRAALEEQARQMENILNLQRAQYAQLQEHMEETRRASHDLRQHRNIIRSYLDSGNEARLREYLNANADSGPGDGFCTWCRNYSVNMLLNHYAGRLRAQGTEFEFSFDLPEGLAVPEPDLCVVLGNLLENALEACAGQEGGLRPRRRAPDGQQRYDHSRRQQLPAPAQGCPRRQPALHQAPGRGHRHKLYTPDSPPIPRQGRFKLAGRRFSSRRVPEPAGELRRAQKSAAVKTAALSV